MFKLTLSVFARKPVQGNAREFWEAEVHLTLMDPGEEYVNLFQGRSRMEAYVAAMAFVMNKLK